MSIEIRLKDSTGNIIHPETSINVIQGLDTTLENKVDKIEGKGLSTNDLTNALLAKLEGLTQVTTETVSGWGYTKNTGTVTSITMNSTSYTQSSGVVNLGTVITTETTLSKGTTSGSGNAVTDISVNNHTITLTKGNTFVDLTSAQTITGAKTFKANVNPSTTNTYSLGTSSLLWKAVYATTLYEGTTALSSKYCQFYTGSSTTKASNTTKSTTLRMSLSGNVLNIWNS